MVLEQIDMSSPYKRRMVNVIRGLREQGGTTFTQDWLAKEMGAKVTQSFRRRISELEREGVVQRFTFLGEKNGQKVGYEIVTKWVQQPLPEFPF